MIVTLPDGRRIISTTTTTTTDNTDLFGYPVVYVTEPEPESRPAYERDRDEMIAALRDRLAVTRTPIVRREREGYTSIDKRRDFSEEPDAWKVRSPRVFR